MFSKIIKSKPIQLLLLAITVRFLFLFIGSHYYFSRPSVYFDNDTFAWANMFQNWWETGNLTIDSNDSLGWFFRMPVYCFFLGIFWLFTGDWYLTFKVVAVAQVLLDTIAVLLIYKTILNWSKNSISAYWAAFLYALYPFAIVWTPVAYAESLTQFLIIWSLYLVSSKRFVSAGLILALGMLTRPQAILVAPFIFIAITGLSLKNFFSKQALQFGLACAFLFAIWPARNLLLHNKLVIAQDLTGSKNWTLDVSNFREYIFSVKAEWEPQFSQIVKGEEVEIPSEAYAVPQDLEKLKLAFSLSQSCAPGFSYWSGYHADVIKSGGCLDSVALLYEELRLSQVKNNPVNYYIWVPLQNLKKALFKFDLYKAEGAKLWLGRLLFSIRSFLIVLGFFASFYLWRRFPASRNLILMSLGYFSLLYLYLCFGTTRQCRNIEVRFFLLADTLLLLPAGYWLGFMFSKNKTHAE